MADQKEADRLVDLGTKFKEELGAIINKEEYGDLSAYAIIGAIEVMKSELMDYLFQKSDQDPDEPWRASLKL